jgi:hypothetical protein
MSKKLSVIFSVIFVFVLCALIFAGNGKNLGVIKMLDVDIIFFDAKGTTVTNENGIYYHYYGRVKYENKVYPPEYWGTFPLYFFGGTTGVKVTVTNNGPVPNVKMRVIVECNVLRTNGENGVSLLDPKTTEFSVAKGETKTIDCSFISVFVPGAESGLDRFTVRVQRINQGGGPGNEYPGLIMQKEGIFCPPEFADLEGEGVPLAKQLARGPSGVLTYPKTFTLHNATPNPFNNMTMIGYDIPLSMTENGDWKLQASMTTISIYDVQGRLVKNLLNEVKTTGYYKVTWNGTDNGNRPVDSGMYLLKIRSGEFVQQKKVFRID